MINQESITSLFDYLESKAGDIRAMSYAIEAVDGLQKERQGNREGRSREEWKRQAQAEALEDWQAIKGGKSIYKAAKDRGISYSQMRRRMQSLDAS